MKILSFDTSGEILSIAVFDDEKKMASFESSGFVRHSSILLASIQKLLAGKKIKPGQIDVIAVGLGPGSFTGLRVGVTAAKVLAYALKKKIVGVSSLDAVASGMADAEGVFTLALDARRQKYYIAVYQRKAGHLLKVRKLKLEDEKKLTREKNVIKTGDGTRLHPKAEFIARLALEDIKRNKFTDPFQLEPVYLYPRDCNVTKKK